MRYIRKPYEIEVYTVDEILIRDDLPDWVSVVKKMLRSGARGFDGAKFVASTGSGMQRYYFSEESLLKDFEPVYEPV